MASLISASARLGYVLNVVKIVWQKPLFDSGSISDCRLAHLVLRPRCADIKFRSSKLTPTIIIGVKVFVIVGGTRSSWTTQISPAKHESRTSFPHPYQFPGYRERLYPRLEFILTRRNQLVVSTRKMCRSHDTTDGRLGILVRQSDWEVYWDNLICCSQSSWPFSKKGLGGNHTTERRTVP
jgi:hypothetical protein